MSRCWLALVDGPAKGADAAARAIATDGHPAGTLAAWRRRAKPVREALRVDERLIDPDGSAAWISLVLPPSGVRLAFDDPAVQQARRLVLYSISEYGMTLLPVLEQICLWGRLHLARLQDSSQ